MAVGVAEVAEVAVAAAVVVAVAVAVAEVLATAMEAWRGSGHCKLSQVAGLRSQPPWISLVTTDV